MTNSVNNKLLGACLLGNLEEMKEAISKGESANANFNEFQTNQTPISIVCKYGYLDLLKYLLTSPELKEHVDINSKDGAGRTPILIAGMYGHVEMMKYLLTSPDLKIKSNISDIDNDGWSVLMNACAAFEGNLDIVKFLLTDEKVNKNVDINHVSKLKTSALLVACGNGCLEIIKYLLSSPDLKKHANLYQYDDDGYDVLMSLNYSHEKYYEIVEYLIFDQNFKVSENTLNWLKNGSPQQTEILKMLNYRELNQNINKHTTKKPSKYKL